MTRTSSGGSGSTRPSTPSVGKQFAHDVSSVASARRFVRTVLARWNCDSEDAVFAVGELAANAVLYGRGRFRVSLRHEEGKIVLEVTDSSPEPPVMSAPDLYAERGRGLLIVDAVTKRWGTRPTDDGGKTVWAELEARSAEESERAPRKAPVRRARFQR